MTTESNHPDPILKDVSVCLTIVLVNAVGISTYQEIENWWKKVNQIKETNILKKFWGQEVKMDMADVCRWVDGVCKNVLGCHPAKVTKQTTPPWNKLGVVLCIACTNL